MSRTSWAVLIGFLFCLHAVNVTAQPPAASRQQVRTVTIPISIFSKQELRAGQAEEYLQADRIVVSEDNDEQSILSIKSVSDSPLSVAVLIQGDLANGFNLQLDDIREFIRSLPQGSRVMVAYLRSGSADIRQKFTEDREAAAKSLRAISGSTTDAPRSPYSGILDIIGRFDATPIGRRAIIMFSDGLDTTDGLTLASITQSADLDQAILRSQRRSVAVYPIYYPTQMTDRVGSNLAFMAQGALDKLAEQTGGRSFASGSAAPVNFRPFFKELDLSLTRQFSLTYLSTHMKKGYHKVKVMSTNPEIKIVHPKGYYYR